MAAMHELVAEPGGVLVQRDRLRRLAGASNNRDALSLATVSRRIPAGQRSVFRSGSIASHQFKLTPPDQVRHAPLFAEFREPGPRTRGCVEPERSGYCPNRNDRNLPIYHTVDPRLTSRFNTRRAVAKIL